jgi:hypothetical protein
MPTVSTIYTIVYRTDLGAADPNEITSVNPAGQTGSILRVQVDSASPLQPGDSFPVQVLVFGTVVATDTAIYRGTNANGDLFVELRGLGSILSINTYAVGDSPPFIAGPYVCFLAGTRIATPAGEVAVEALQPGDLVLTADGRAVPVRFVGRQTVHSRFTPAWRCHPVRIAAGALAGSVPARDLLVSPSHGIVVDGAIAFASALVNGDSIRQVPPPAETFVYYAIETDAHEVILAEGCPVESFVDHVSRQLWDNHAEYLALHGGDRPIRELPLPHAKSRRQLPAEAHARMAARAAELRAGDAAAA